MTGPLEMKVTIDTAEAQAFVTAVHAAAKGRFAIARVGDVVLCETSRPFSCDEHVRILEALQQALAGTGVRAVLLPFGVRVARTESEEHR
ncbi:MAG: hypothetical protein ACM32F_08475 [Betaproteobacteria bacterium]